MTEDALDEDLVLLTPGQQSKLLKIRPQLGLSVEQRIALYFKLEMYDKKLAHYRRAARGYFRKGGLLKHLPIGSYYRDDSDPDYEIMTRPCQASSSSVAMQRPSSDVDAAEDAVSPPKKKQKGSLAGGIIRIILRSKNIFVSYVEFQNLLFLLICNCRSQVWQIYQRWGWFAVFGNTTRYLLRFLLFFCCVNDFSSLFLSVFRGGVDG